MDYLCPDKEPQPESWTSVTHTDQYITEDIELSAAERKAVTQRTKFNL